MTDTPVTPDVPQVGAQYTLIAKWVGGFALAGAVAVLQALGKLPDGTFVNDVLYPAGGSSHWPYSHHLSPSNQRKLTMSKSIIALALALGLGACSTAQQAKLVNFENADMAAVAKIAAMDVNGPDQLGPKCFSFINTNLQAIQTSLAGAVQAPVQPTGLASILETGIVATDNAVSLIGQVQSQLPYSLRVGFDNACGPLVMHLLGEQVALTQAATAATAAAALVH
jgi:hypothetical protein